MHSFLKELKKDHDTVQDILKQMSETGDKACKDRERLFKMLKMELIPHMKAEEKVLYAPMKEIEEIKEDTMEALEEHHVTDMVFKELEKMDCGHEGWLAKVAVFTELVDHHIKEEESQIFKDVKQVFSDEEIEQVYVMFQKEKKKLLTSMEHKPEKKPTKTVKKPVEAPKKRKMKEATAP